MTWPSSDVATSALDAGTDVPPRAEFKSWADKFNQMRNHVSAYAQSLLDDTDAAAMRTTLDVYSKGQIDTFLTAAVPAGAVLHFAMNAPPTGWVKANGAAVSRTTYAVLFAAIGTTFGAGDGSTTFNLPDLRGEFVRGWDDSRGVDSGRVFGSAQADAMQGHFHELWGGRNDTGGSHNPGGVISHVGDNFGDGESFGSRNNVRSPKSDGTNGTPRTASETRPRNAALLACIKF